MFELTSTDYKILKYISQFDSISKNEIINNFSKVSAIEFRLDELSKETYSSNSHLRSLPNSSYILKEFDYIKVESGVTEPVSKNSYHITELGKIALQDYQIQKRETLFNFWTKSILTPILVAIAITLLTNWLLRLLQLG